MNESPVDTLEQAIALYRAPARLSQLKGRPLGHTLLLLRIAADDRAAIATAAQATGETAETVVDAALLYIQQVLFSDSADAYRLLGARPEDSTAQIQEHYRWLMRWLHPDRQPERWEVAYSDRVNQAWQILRSPERRDAYDSSLHSGTLDVREREVPRRRLAANQVVSKPLLSPQTRRRLPQFILGTLAVGAFVVLGLLYWSQEETPAMQVATNESASKPKDAVMHAAVLPTATVSTSAIAPRIAPMAVVAALPDRAAMIAMPARNEEPRSNAVAVAPAASRVPVSPDATHRAPTIEREVPAFATPTPSGKPHDPVVATSADASRQHVGEPKSIAVSTTDTAHLDAAIAASPAVALQPAKPAAPSTARSPQDATSTLVRSFTRAYAAGDLPTMMELFSADAVNNRGGVDAIASDYDKLFRDTQSRELRLERIAWSTSEDRIVGSGPFEANILRRGESTAHRVNGWITIDARLIEGRWRIQRIIHQNTQ